MGVSGSGKTTLALALAEELDCAFQEGDSLHPAANLRKMSAGHPLDDDDRRPWLDAVAAWLADRRTSGRCGIVSCSALKRAYRDRLRRADPDLRFVLLHPDRDTLARRVASRRGHPFPPELLQSQLDTLEPPDPDEGVFTVDPQLPPDAAARSVCEWLARANG